MLRIRRKQIENEVFYCRGVEGAAPYNSDFGLWGHTQYPQISAGAFAVFPSSLLTNPKTGAKLKAIFEKEVRPMFAICYSWNMPMSVRGDAHRAGLTLSYPEIRG